MSFTGHLRDITSKRRIKMNGKHTYKCFTILLVNGQKNNFVPNSNFTFLCVKVLNWYDHAQEQIKI